jgi:PAS domain S-box-containing protein
MPFNRWGIRMQLKILIVDDSTTDRLIIQSMLSEYHTVTAGDGVEALRIIKEQSDINLIILDLNMPNMDGFQVLESLRADKQYSRLRTIILTNYDELDNEIRGLRLGAVDYIRKPINMESLKIRIEVHSELLRVQKALERKLQNQELTIDTIFNQVPVGIAISNGSCITATDGNGKNMINPVFEKITGRSKEALNSLSWLDISHPDERDNYVYNLQRLKAGEIKSFSMDTQIVKPDGTAIWINLIIAELALNGDAGKSYICLVKDINEQKKTENALLESERSKAILLSHLPGLAYRCAYDRDWTMQFVSEGCYKLTGYTAESLLFNRDLSFNDIIAPEYREKLWEEWKQILSKGQEFNYEYEIITAKGERKWVLEMGEGIFNSNNEVEALEGIIIDISDRKEIENYLRYNMEHDSWTALYNRTYLENMLNRDLKANSPSKKAVITINLSPIQTVTTANGFHYTQELMKNISDGLVMLSNDKRMLFKTYENLFAFYIKKYESTKELADFCQLIIGILKPLLGIERVGAGLGIFEINDDKILDADKILKDVLIASEKALSLYDGEIGYWFFDSSLEEQINRENEIKKELANIEISNDNGGLYLLYQPIYDLKKKCVCGFEALARLECKSLGLVSPLEFIPIAEKTKLIIPLGNKIITQALTFLKRLRELGYTDIEMSINVSINQFLKPGFSNSLKESINCLELPPEYISLELTESVFEANYQEINFILGELIESGLHIEIDDFGTGYSSLARVSELNVNCLKIDKCFIDSLLYQTPEQAITGDIISMAHKLGYSVIAEGVEHVKQFEYLINNGCDRIQGYLIDKPLDWESAVQLLKDQANGYKRKEFFV